MKVYLSKMSVFSLAEIYVGDLPNDDFSDVQAASYLARLKKIATLDSSSELFERRFKYTML